MLCTSIWPSQLSKWHSNLPRTICMTNEEVMHPTIDLLQSSIDVLVLMTLKSKIEQRMTREVMQDYDPINDPSPNFGIALHWFLKDLALSWWMITHMPNESIIHGFTAMLQAWVQIFCISTLLQATLACSKRPYDPLNSPSSMQIYQEISTWPMKRWWVPELTCCNHPLMY